jgi:hypothetical protein
MGAAGGICSYKKKPNEIGLACTYINQKKKKNWHVHCLWRTREYCSQDSWEFDPVTG